jgi:hypothetical protein
LQEVRKQRAELWKSSVKTGDSVDASSRALEPLLEHQIDLSVYGQITHKLVEDEDKGDDSEKSKPQEPP